MRTVALRGLLIGSIAWMACSPSGGGSGGGDVGSAGDAGTAGAAGETSATGQAAPGTAPGAAPGKPAPGEPAPAVNLALSDVTLRNIGRKGDALRITLSGADTLKQTSAAVVRFQDENGADLTVLDTNWDGLADSAVKRFHFDESTFGTATFKGSITLPNAFDSNSKVQKAVVMLEDSAGGHSSPVTATLVLQDVRHELDTCDVAKIANRCDPGLSCSGTPATCHQGVAPTLTKTAYFGGAAPLMLFRGTEPDDDLASAQIDFLDASGKPIDGAALDAVGDLGVTLDATASVQGGAFLVRNLPTSDFAANVPKIAVTLSDAAGHVGPRTVLSLTSTPTKTLSQACDADGFDTCTTGNVCSPGLPNVANTCKAVGSLRTAKCAAGPVLDPAKGITTAFGSVVGASLWDAPDGCVGAESKNRPEAVVTLHLTSQASEVTLTTALPETNFDTALYLLPSCSSLGASALACNDDDKGYASTITVKDVPAGDYAVVVDSVHPQGGSFGVSVSVK